MYPMRSTSLIAIRVYSCAFSSRELFLSMRNKRLVTASRGLLISCAIVPAKRPVAASFSVFRNASAARLRSLTSRAIVDAPVITPEELRIGEMETDTSTGAPSFLSRTVSKWSIDSPRRKISSVSSISRLRSEGLRMDTCCPIISAAV